MPSESEILSLERATKDAYVARACDFLRPNGEPLGIRGTTSKIRLMPGGASAAQDDYDYLSMGGTPLVMPNGSGVRLPYGAGTVVLRPNSTSTGDPAIDVNIPGLIRRKLHY